MRIELADGLKKNHRSNIKLLDATLRDGSYAVDFQFCPGFVGDLLSGIDAAGLDLIELGHGVGIEAERAGHAACNIPVADWCAIAGERLENTPWGAFAQPSFTRFQTIENMSKRGMSFVRIGMEAHTVPDNLDYIRSAQTVCDQVFLNLMKTSTMPPEQLQWYLRDVPRDISGVYVVDSYGCMLPSEVRSYVEILQEDFDLIGFHGHDNLGLANANSLEAIAAGATFVDGTLHGIGRGSGNATTEALAGLLSRHGIAQFNYRDLARMAEFCRHEMQVQTGDRYMQVLGGVVGVHTSLFPAIEKICSEFTIDAAALMEHANTLSDHDPKESDLLRAAKHLSRPSNRITNHTSEIMVKS